MSNAVQFVTDQIESDEVWKKDHIRAAECDELQRVIVAGLKLFQLIRTTDEFWSKGVQEGKQKFDASVARALFDAYAAWVGPCDPVLERVSQFEREGYDVDGSSELRKATSAVRRILKTDLDEVVTKLEAIRAA